VVVPSVGLAFFGIVPCRSSFRLLNETQRVDVWCLRFQQPVILYLSVIYICRVLMVLIVYQKLIIIDVDVDVVK